jgi:hypothetical protein
MMTARTDVVMNLPYCQQQRVALQFGLSDRTAPKLNFILNWHCELTAKDKFCFYIKSDNLITAS